MDCVQDIYEPRTADHMLPGHCVGFSADTVAGEAGPSTRWPALRQQFDFSLLYGQNKVFSSFFFLDMRPTAPIPLHRR